MYEPPEWRYLDEVDVVGKWQRAGHHEAAESAKWQERKEAFDKLVEELTSNPKLDRKANYGLVMGIIKDVLKRDSNINVVVSAVRALEKLARGMRSAFVPFIPMLFTALCERLKEKRATLRDPLVLCLDAVLATCEGSPEKLTAWGLEAAGIGNPQVKSQLPLFFYRFFLIYNSATPSLLTLLKELTPKFSAWTSDGDGEVRASAIQFIGGVVRLIGEPPTVQLTSGLNQDKTKWSKVLEWATKATEAAAEIAQVRSQNGGPCTSEGGLANDGLTSTDGDAIASGEAVAAAVLDPFDLATPIDLTSKLGADWHELMMSKKWQERKQAVEQVIAALGDVPCISADSDTNEIISALQKCITTDVNVNVAGDACTALAAVSSGMRARFSPYASKTVAVALDKSKERKLLQKLATLLDSTLLCTTLESVAEALVDGSTKPTAQQRSQFAKALSRLLQLYSRDSAPRECLEKIMAPALAKLCDDADQDVREAATEALGCVVHLLPHLDARLPTLVDNQIRADRIREQAKLESERPAPDALQRARILALLPRGVANNNTKVSGGAHRPAAPAAKPATQPVRPARQSMQARPAVAAAAPPPPKAVPKAPIGAIRRTPAPPTRPATTATAAVSTQRPLPAARVPSTTAAVAARANVPAAAASVQRPPPPPSIHKNPPTVSARSTTVLPPTAAATSVPAPRPPVTARALTVQPRSGFGFRPSSAPVSARPVPTANSSSTTAQDSSAAHK